MTICAPPAPLLRTAFLISLSSNGVLEFFCIIVLKRKSDRLSSRVTFPCCDNIVTGCSNGLRVFLPPLVVQNVIGKQAQDLTIDRVFFLLLESPR